MCPNHQNYDLTKQFFYGSCKITMFFYNSTKSRGTNTNSSDFMKERLIRHPLTLKNPKQFNTNRAVQRLRYSIITMLCSHFSSLKSYFIQKSNFLFFRPFLSIILVFFWRKWGKNVLFRIFPKKGSYNCPKILKNSK